MRINKLRVLQYLLLIIEIGYLVAINIIPALKPLRSSIMAWILFAIYTINLIFIWSLDKKKTTHFEDKEKRLKDARESQEKLLDRSRWYKF